MGGLRKNLVTLVLKKREGATKGPGGLSGSTGTLATGKFIAAAPGKGRMEVGG